MYSRRGGERGIQDKAKGVAWVQQQGQCWNGWGRKQHKVKGCPGQEVEVGAERGAVWG
jgi:hypothetical protein